MFGEISPKMIGKTNAASFSLDSLIITGSVPSYNAPSVALNIQSTASANLVTNGAMGFSGSSLSIGRAGTPLQGNPTELNFGQAYAQRMICLYDGGTLGNQDQNQFYGFGVTPGTLHYSVDLGGSHKFYRGTSSSTSTLLFTISSSGVTTANNTLDDGSGNVTIKGSTNAPVVVNTTAVATCGIQFQYNTGTVGGTIGYSNVGMGIQNGNGDHILQQVTAGSTDKSLKTNNNTLDDGTGAATFVGTITATKGSATPGMNIQTTVAGDGGYLVVQNTNSTNQVYFGIDGVGLTSIQAGAAIVSTDSTHGLPIYLTPGNGTNWALKAITTSSQGYITTGNGFPWITTATAGRNSINLVVTAANCLTGIVVTNTIVTTGFTWTTDSGTNLYSAMGSPAVGTTLPCLWSNNNNNAGAVMTIAFGSGVSGLLRGTTIANNQSMLIFFRCTGTNTFTCYS